MKVFYKNVKILSLLLSLSFLFQSCTIYKSSPVSLDAAVAAGRKTKITTTDHKTTRFREIQKTDTIYYGYQSINNQTVITPLDKTKIQSIKVENKTVSTLLSALCIAVPAGVLIAAITSAPSF